MRLILFFLSLLLCPVTATAYVGPGLGLGTIGAVLGMLFSVVLAVIGFFWYPLKRLLGIGKKKNKNSE